MMILAAIKLSENAKKALVIFFLIFIIVFVLIGYISLAIRGVMKKQGSKADAMLSNVVKADFFNKEKKLVWFGFRKNVRVFFLEARIPFLVLLSSTLAYLVYCLFTGKWGYNPFNSDNGFGTLFFKFSGWPKAEFFGITLISGWPEMVVKPHFETSAIFSYFFVPVCLIGLIWYLVCTQAYIARAFRIRKIAKGVFRKKLIPDEPTSLISE